MEISPPAICKAGMRSVGLSGPCPLPQLLTTTLTGGRAEQTIPTVQRGMLRPQWSFFRLSWQGPGAEDSSEGSQPGLGPGLPAL